MLEDKIRYALADRVLSVVAKRTGLSLRTLSSVKQGNRNHNAVTLRVLAEYLGVGDDQP